MKTEPSAKIVFPLREYSHFRLIDALELPARKKIEIR